MIFPISHDNAATMRRILLAAAVLALATCSLNDEGRRRDAPEDIERRIRFYTGKIERYPRLYPVYVQLANAYFQKAMLTSDPVWLALARNSLERSVAIVETHEAQVTMARIANYAHRFDGALRWGRRALPGPQSRETPDPGVVAVLVEAHSALGQYDEARALLPRDGAAPDFFTAIAHAGWFASQRRFREASVAYDAAAELARESHAAKAWAHAMAGGMLIDAGDPELARPHLDAARRADASSVQLRLHEAEYLESTRDYGKALTVYRSLLTERPGDPDLHARAYKCAAALGQRSDARRHFDAAAGGFRQALDAGEVYSLGALAQLYAEAGVNLDEAAALAERNLQFRRDHEGRSTLARVHAARNR